MQIEKSNYNIEISISSNFGHIMPHFELFLIIFLLLKGVLFNMKDVHMDSTYISVQMDFKKSITNCFQ